jgi:CRP-like cAMP-binding protein
MKSISETNEEYICDIQAPCFQLLSMEEIEIIRASKTQVLFRKGESLTKQGTFTSSILFLMSGLAKQYIEGDGTHNLNLRIIKSGEFIGLSAVFTKNTFNYSATALTEARAFLIEKEAVARVAQQNGAFAFNLIKRYSEHNTMLYNTINDLMYKQMNGRLADALLYLSSEEFAGEDIFTNLSRKDIADFAGLSTENVVKLLKSYEKEGILNLEGKDIKILNRKTLMDIGKRG